MGEIYDKWVRAYRDFNTDGLPASGAHEPAKREIREIAPLIEGNIAAAALAGGDIAQARALIDPLVATSLAAQRAAENANGVVSQAAKALPAQIAAASAQATQIATRAAEAALAAATSLPNVYPTIAAGVAATAVNGVFYAQARRGIAMYRKTGANASLRLFSLTDSPTLPLSLFVEPDAKIVEFASTSAFSKTLTARTAIFDAADVGKTIAIAGAGNNGAKLITTIASVESATSVTLNTAAGASTSDKGATLGTDCRTALSTALSGLRMAGGGELVIDGLFFLGSPVVAAFTDNVAQISITGYGGDAGLIIAVGIDQDALSLSGGGRILVDGINLIGTPLEQCDARRVLSFASSFVTLRNCGFFGVACIGANDGAVVYSENGDLATESNFFGSCVGGLANPTVLHRNFAGASSLRDRFLDYGRFQGILFIKTGLSFTKAWIYGENQFAEDANAVGQSVFRVTDSHFDEGHIFAVAVTTDLGAGKRIDRVHLSGTQINNTFSNPGCGIYVERADHVVIEQGALGWCNVPHTGLTLNDCGDVLVESVNITPGAPGTPTGVADEIVATDVSSLIVRNSDFARFTFSRVGQFQQIRNGVGGVAPFQKGGRVIDADFPVPPAIGTLAIDVVNKKLYARFAEGWLASPAFAASTDATFALNNVTPTTGRVTDQTKYAKFSGGSMWGNCTANLMQTLVGGFSMKVSFPSAAAGNFVKVGVAPADFGSEAVTGVNDLRLGVLQDNGSNIYLAHNGDLIAGPFPYAAGQTVQLDYNDGANTVVLKINGTVVVNGMAAPSDLTPTLETRFTSTLYNEGSAYQLLGFDPL